MRQSQCTENIWKDWGSCGSGGRVGWSLIRGLVVWPGLLQSACQSILEQDYLTPNWSWWLVGMHIMAYGCTYGDTAKPTGEVLSGGRMVHTKCWGVTKQQIWESKGNYLFLKPVSSGNLRNFSFWHFSIGFIFQPQRLQVAVHNRHW